MSKRIFGFSEIDGNNQNEIMIVKAGKWNHPMYGEFKVTAKTIREFKENFDSGVRGVDIGVDIEHDSYSGYVGWFKELFIKGSALYGVIEWTAKGAELLKGKAYKYFSPELAFEYEDMETHEQFENVLIGGGITNRPYFKGLKPLLASESNAESEDNYNLFYNSENMDEETKAEVSEDKVEESAEETVEEIVEGGAEEATEEKAEEATEEVAKEVKEEATEEVVEEAAEEVKANEKKMSLSEENAKLKKQLRANEIANKVDSIVCSEGKTDRTFLPSAKERITKFFEGLNDNQIAEFNEIAKMTVDSGLFKEHGTDVAESNVEPAKTLNSNLVEEAKKLSEKEGIEFEEALGKLGAQYKSIKDM